jgi:DNA anti-recombination protein RmuC
MDMSDTYEAAIEIREAIRDVASELRVIAELLRELREMRAEVIALTEIIASARRVPS